MGAQCAITLARVFSGIQPSGVPHLGNYFGALSQWTRLAKERKLAVTECSIHDERNSQRCTVKPDNNRPTLIEFDTPIYCIVDVHAYSSPTIKYGTQLYNNILDTTASLLAIGLTTKNCILFRQSDLLEHNYLDNVLHNFITTQRLSRMNQYKEKTSNTSSRGVSNGLLTYPVLQAADILLYGANFVPIGADQTQHIELTRDIARNFNKAVVSDVFKEPQPLFNNSEHARRIRSLREPAKKMSKSDPNKKAFIEIVDEPDVLREKVKKAMTDNISDVYFDADARPGVSNLLRIHHLATGQSFSEIQAQFAGITSAQYKLLLADILIEKFKPVREEFKRVRNEHDYLESVLKHGHDQAKPMAVEMVMRVKNLLGSNRVVDM
uniref:tryptophan--tRNA ligase n=1 Tax=Aceria tosichella TaxID=561515 RepID=A0A6G1SDF6_9ACAR